jgi:hypothetical protein
MTGTKPSGDKPCPFHRALARTGHIGENVALEPFGKLFAKALGATGLAARAHALAIEFVGAVGNGVASIVRNSRWGFRPRELRGGPFDKRGGGTRILSQTGAFDLAEFQRFESFGRQHPRPDAGTELGWGMRELDAYLDANQARGHGSWYERHVLMQNELPLLLRLMGRGEGDARYLSATEVRAFYESAVLPARIEKRIEGLQIADRARR